VDSHAGRERRAWPRSFARSIFCICGPSPLCTQSAGPAARGRGRRPGASWYCGGGAVGGAGRSCGCAGDCVQNRLFGRLQAKVAPSRQAAPKVQAGACPSRLQKTARCDDHRRRWGSKCQGPKKTGSPRRTRDPARSCATCGMRSGASGCSSNAPMKTSPLRRSGGDGILRRRTASPSGTACRTSGSTWTGPRDGAAGSSSSSS